MSAPLPRLFGQEVRRVHFAGVGGMGAGPLAVYLAGLGFTVTGEDDAMGAEMAAVLASAGVKLGAFPAGAELLVHSSAIGASHPARRAAESAGVPRVRRGELLAEITRDRKLIAVCGSHGKTTTTAMLITAMRRAQFPGGYVLGGLLADGTPPAHPGSNDWVVAEIDESDGTIEQFAPQLTVVVNLDWDHPDHYRDFSELESTFAALLARTRGTVLLNSTCEVSNRLRSSAGARQAETLTFGAGGDYRSEIAGEDTGRLKLRLGGRFPIPEAQLKAQGAFNAANATAALAAAHLAGAPLAPQLLADYPGVRRRQTVLLASPELTAIEDYAHHPAEIRALLASLRAQIPAGGRLLAVFQPHRYSRTAQFRREFAEALTGADRVYLLDVYPAGEAPVSGGTTAELAADLSQAAPALPLRHTTSDEEFFRTLDAEVRTGDWIAFVGAGDVDRRARVWLERRAAVRPAWDAHLAAFQTVVSSATRLRREEPLAGRTTLRVGGAARIYAEPASVDDLQALLRTAGARGVAVFPLGRGSNLVVPDTGVEGLVISLAHESWAAFAPQGDGSVRAGAGLRLKNLCGLAAKAGLVGFEFLEGIPGTVGGALRMNAGAMGGWMFDVVDEVQLITLAGEVRTMPKAAMHVDYRHCAELHDAIALSARLRPAAQADAEAVRRQMDAYARKRHESQPREPSAGCIFKNPPGNSAGRLIDESGLKGTRVGDAEVSPVHANFIVNRGHATGNDVIELVRRIRARVREAKGVDLTPEVLLYGQRWEDVL
jgi:UDP-N-acetylmuramate--alanine ligase